MFFDAPHSLSGGLSKMGRATALWSRSGLKSSILPEVVPQGLITFNGFSSSSTGKNLLCCLLWLGDMNISIWWRCAHFRLKKWIRLLLTCISLNLINQNVSRVLQMPALPPLVHLRLTWAECQRCAAVSSASACHCCGSAGSEVECISYIHTWSMMTNWIHLFTALLAPWDPWLSVYMISLKGAFALTLMWEDAQKTNGHVQCLTYFASALSMLDKMQVENPWCTQMPCAQTGAEPATKKSAGAHRDWILLSMGISGS